MTTPQYPWASTDPSDLPQGVIPPSQLGTALQDHSQGKYTNLAGSRFPGIAKGTAAGSPTNPGGPIGFVTSVFSRIVSRVANADPATINGPDDIVAEAGGFFGGLPLIQTAIIQPLSHLLSWITGRPPEDFDTVAELKAAFFDWLDGIPILGDIVKAITGATGPLSMVKNFFDDLFSGLQGLNPFSIFSRIGDVFFHQAAVSNTASTAASTGQSIIDRLISGYNRTTSTGNAPALLEAVGANIDNRITVLEGGAVTEFLLTSSTTIDVSAYTEVDVIAFGSSPLAESGYTGQLGSLPIARGAAHGGMIRAQFKVAELSNPSAVKCVVGTNSAPSLFDANADNTTWKAKTNPGIAAEQEGPTFRPTQSAPGTGGNGGQGFSAGSDTNAGKFATAGDVGQNSVLGAGGAAGQPGKGPSNGGPGESVSVTNSGKGGGAGGGGGGGANGDNLSYAGARGGNAGYPGAGPGAGGNGSKGSFQGGGSGGLSGAVANGFMFVRAK